MEPKIRAATKILLVKAGNEKCIGWLVLMVRNLDASSGSYVVERGYWRRCLSRMG